MRGPLEGMPSKKRRLVDYFDKKVVATPEAQPQGVRQATGTPLCTLTGSKLNTLPKGLATLPSGRRSECPGIYI